MGYLACGIIPAHIFDEYTQSLDKRVKSFPKSKGLYEPLYNHARQPDEAKSVIVCTRSFNNYKIPAGLSEFYGKYYLFDGRLEYSQEYRAKSEFTIYLRTLGLKIFKNPVPARLAAAKAGLGKFGRNNFIYDSQHGSNIKIDTWVVDKELEYDVIEGNIYLSACNDGCGKCAKACPTKALSGSFSMDMSRCVTRLANLSKEVPDEETRAQMGTSLYGCDACQDACPLNKDKYVSSEEFPLLAEHEKYMKPESILEMDEDTYKNIVNRRFWYTGEDAHWFWQCNALRCMVNSGDKKYHDLIKQYCNHEDERISGVARWGRRKLGI